MIFFSVVLGKETACGAGFEECHTSRCNSIDRLAKMTNFLKPLNNAGLLHSGDTPAERTDGHASAIEENQIAELSKQMARALRMCRRTGTSLHLKAQCSPCILIAILHSRLQRAQGAAHRCDYPASQAALDPVCGAKEQHRFVSCATQTDRDRLHSADRNQVL